MDTPTSTMSSRAGGPRTVPSDRRTRLRLRELCDEVIASYRVATDSEPWTEGDRREGRELMQRITARRTQ